MMTSQTTVRVERIGRAEYKLHSPEFYLEISSVVGIQATEVGTSAAEVEHSHRLDITDMT